MGRQWEQSGLIKIGDLYLADQLSPFMELQQDFGIAASSLFKYMQAKEFMSQLRTGMFSLEIIPLL